MCVGAFVWESLKKKYDLYRGHFSNQTVVVSETVSHTPNVTVHRNGTT